MKVSINEKEVSVPQCWNDCEKSQIIALAELFYTSCPLDLIPSEKLFYFKLKATMILTGLTWEDLKTWSIEAGEGFILELGELLTVVDWLFIPVLDEDKKPTGGIALKMNLTKQPFKFIQVKPHKFYGCLDEGYNLEFEEFKLADTAFLYYAKTREEWALNKLMAIIYRPHKQKHLHKSINKWEGDVRQPLPLKFNKPSLDGRIKVFEKLPPGYKYAVMIFWSSVRGFIISKHPDIFKPSSQSSDKTVSWNTIHLELAGGTILHDDTIARKPLASVLFQLSMNERNRKKRLLQMAKDASRRKRGIRV